MTAMLNLYGSNGKHVHKYYGYGAQKGLSNRDKKAKGDSLE